MGSAGAVKGKMYSHHEPRDSRVLRVRERHDFEACFCAEHEETEPRSQNTTLTLRFWTCTALDAVCARNKVASLPVDGRWHANSLSICGHCIG